MEYYVKQVLCRFSPSKMAHIVALLDFSTSDIPLTYLGCPILKNAPKTSHFQAIGKLDI